MSFYRGPKVVTNGLVLGLDAADRNSYPGSGTSWLDLSGNNYTCTLSGPTFSTDNSGTLNFNGISDFVSIPINAAFNTASVTFEAWVNLNSTGVRHIVLVNWQGNALEVNSNATLTMYNFSSGGQLGSTTSSTISWGTWAHIAGTYDNSAQELKSYINGNLGATRASTGSTIYSVGVHKISGTDYSGPVNGKVAVARHYNRALSASEVAQNFNALRGRFGI